MLSIYKYFIQLFFLTASRVLEVSLTVLKLPRRIILSVSMFNFFLACMLVLFYNFSFWKNVFASPYYISLWNVIFLFSLFFC
jgi:hypothetical protein